MDIDQFFIAGINYKKTDAAVRGTFAIGPAQYASILQSAAGQPLFVLSTCNRTEIYGLAADASDLIALLCSQTSGTAEQFRELCYIKKGDDAIRHIFSVGAGLDSQILGDYEIVGQMKAAVRTAKEHGCIDGFLERLFNTVLQASKCIKNETQLSGGTISVSFAAIQFIRQQLQDTKDKKIVLLGTGKIGANTCRNLVDYLDTRNIVLINRTDEKAEQLAAELGLASAAYADRNREINAADVVIVATHAETAVITADTLTGNAPKILLDLSIPNNIDPALGALEHITLANVDDLSSINDQTLQKRLADVPRANEIIAAHVAEFEEWISLRRHVPVLRAVKQKLHDMHSCSLFVHANPGSLIDQDAIQKVVNTVAMKMRSRHQPGCHYIEAINDFMTIN